MLPVPHVPLSPATIRRSVALFPVVGAAIGALLGGFGIVLDRWLPAGPIAVLLIAAGALITGGLHLDGLMDTADGLGGRTAEQRLAIMRDSRVGAFGVIAGVLAILGQFACLSALGGRDRFMALVLAYAISRWATAIALALFPAARASGLGAAFQAGAGHASGIASTLLTLPLVLLRGESGLFALGAATAIVSFTGGALTRRLGGLTGDSYGAIAVLTETAVLFAAVGVANR